MVIGGVLTAVVTPFDADGRVDEEAFVALLGHLAENGSDGVVVAGTTGESATLDDEEKLRLFQLAADEGGDLFVVAGTGSNDTAHTVHLTERASQIDGVVAVKQARGKDIAAIEGLDLLAGNDDDLAEVLDVGGTGGILVSSHFIGREMRRMIDEPESRSSIHTQVEEVLAALSVAPLTMTVKAGLNMLGIQVGGCRLPLVDCNEQERATVRAMLERQGLLSAV